MTHHFDREVHVDVTSRHRPVAGEIRAFALERAERLVRFNHSVSRIHVVLDEEHGACVAEILVYVDFREPVFVKEVSHDHRSALDGLLVKTERQLRKDKERRRNHKHPARRTPAAPPLKAPEEQTYEDIVRQRLAR